MFAFDVINTRSKSIMLTCDGAARMPTANPHTILPNNNKAWCVAVPISIQPSTSGRVDNCRVLRRPTASITGPDNIDPNGVAAE